MEVVSKKGESASGRTFLLQALLGVLAIFPPVVTFVTYVDHRIDVTIGTWFAELLLLTIIALAIFESREQVRLPSKISIAAGTALLFTSLSAAILNSINPAYGFGHLAITTTHMLLACGVFILMSGAWAEDSRKILRALWVGATTQILVTYGVIWDASYDPDYNWVYFHAGAGNVRQLGFVGITACALSTGLAATSRSRSMIWCYAAAMLSSMTFLNLIGGRASLIAGLLAVIIAILFVPRSWSLRATALALAIYALSIPLSLIYVPPDESWGFLRIIARSGFEGRLDGYSSGRLEYWMITIDHIRLHPWIGHGEAQFSLLQDIPGQMIPNHPHNAVLQFLFQWGIIGTSLAAILVLNALSPLRELFRSSSWSNVPAFLVFISMSAMAMLEGNFYHVYPSMVTVIALAIMASAIARSSGQSKQPVDKRPT